MTTTATTTKARLEDIAIGDLRASATNPRKHFAPGPLQELADSISAQGIRQPILVRPKAGDTPFEIVAGERRYRAAKIAALALVPCLVSEMSDREAIEVQAVENLQREDLTELEEAASYQMMLDMKDEQTGAPIYTAERLAERFGKEKTHIYRRLTLLRLAPAAQEALQSGDLPATLAVYVARIPSPEAQTQALGKILKPEHKTERLSRAETHEMIGREFMQGLKGAPFKLDDADLLPAAGPCATCPKMSDNCRHLFEGDDQAGKKKVCTDPTCFRQKLDALWAKRTETAKSEGKTVLDEKQSRAVFPPNADAGEMAYDSPYVFLSDKPEDHLLKPEVRETVGTWRRLVEDAEKKTAELALSEAKAKIQKDEDLSKDEKREALALLEKNPPSGMSVPRVIARDQAGAAREIVELKLAITAVEASGEPLFMSRSVGLPSAGGDAFAMERKAQQEAAKLRLAENIVAIGHTHAALVAEWSPSGVWEGLFPIAMGHAGFDGAWLIAKWQGLKFSSGGTADANVYDVVGAWAAGLPPAERQALVPILLQGARLKNSGPGDELLDFCAGAGVEIDLKEITKLAKASLKKGKAKPEKEEKKQATKDLVEDRCGVPAKVKAASKRVKIDADVANVTLDLILRGKPHGEIAQMVGISVPSVQNIKKAAGLVIPGAFEARRAAEWVKAHANGMSAESIAQSYNTTVEDVRGALELDKPAVSSSPIPAAEDLAPPVVAQLIAYDDGEMSLEEMAYRTHLPKDTVRAALRAAGRPTLQCEAPAENPQFQTLAQQALDAAVVAVGFEPRHRTTVLSRYIKRVCGVVKPEAELTGEEKMKIAEILVAAAEAKKAA